MDSSLSFTLFTESSSQLLFYMTQGFRHFLANALVFLLSRFTLSSFIYDLVFEEAQLNFKINSVLASHLAIISSNCHR
jgi:hypothetical protein